MKKFKNLGNQFGGAGSFTEVVSLVQKKREEKLSHGNNEMPSVSALEPDSNDENNMGSSALVAPKSLNTINPRKTGPETDSITGAKRVQSTGANGFKRGLESVSDTGANGSKRVQIRVQDFSETDSVTGAGDTYTGAELVRQTGAKSALAVDPFSVNGLERKLLFLIYENCRKNNTFETVRFNREHFLTFLNCSLNSFKSARARLIKKGLVQLRALHGRGGGTVYVLSRSVFLAINENNSWFQTGADTGSVSSSSFDSYKLFKEKLVIPLPLQHKISPKQLYGYSIADDFWTVEAINETLRHFAFDIYNGNIRTTKENPSSFALLHSNFKKVRPYVSGELEKQDSAKLKQDYGVAQSEAVAILDPQSPEHELWVRTKSLEIVEEFGIFAASLRELPENQVKDLFRASWIGRYEDSKK